MNWRGWQDLVEMDEPPNDNANGAIGGVKAQGAGEGEAVNIVRGKSE